MSILYNILENSRKRISIGACSACKKHEYLENVILIVRKHNRMKKILPYRFAIQITGPHDIYCHYCNMVTQLEVRQ